MSHLRELPPEVLDALLAGSTRTTVPAGSVTHREGEDAPHLELRARRRRPRLRDRTRRPDLDHSILPARRIDRRHVAVRDRLRDASNDPGAGRRGAAAHPGHRRPAAGDDRRAGRSSVPGRAERSGLSFVYEIPGSAFASVRQRVARHLLDLASAGRGADPFRAVGWARSSPSRSASRSWRTPGGTVREVVVRVLRDLRQDGVVRTERDRIVLLEPERLDPGAGVEPQVPDGGYPAADTSLVSAEHDPSRRNAGGDDDRTAT